MNIVTAYFVSAVTISRLNHKVAGFLLTAVQTWTLQPSVKGAPLAGLLAMTVINGLMHAALLGVITGSYIHISHITVTIVMCIMGGRVFPMFTANGMGTVRVTPIPLLEKFSILLVFASLIVVSSGGIIPSGLAATVLVMAGLINLIRAIRWRIWVTFSTPLVWPLHLSYFAISVGLILLGLSVGACLRLLCCRLRTCAI